jgi:hypothetical protein
VTVKEDRAESGQEREWLQQDSLIYGGLMGVGVVCVQPFLTTGLDGQMAKVELESCSEHPVPVLKGRLLSVLPKAI